MSKYRIKVECLEPGASVDVELAAGLECDGFAVIIHRGDMGVSVVSDTSVDTLSQCMEKNGFLRAAAVLADARVRSMAIVSKYRMEEKLEDAFGRMDE